MTASEDRNPSPQAQAPAGLVALTGKRFIKRTPATKDQATAKSLFIGRHAALSKDWLDAVALTLAAEAMAFSSRTNSNRGQWRI